MPWANWARAQGLGDNGEIVSTQTKKDHDSNNFNGQLFFPVVFSEKVIRRAYICVRAQDLLLGRAPGSQEVIRRPWVEGYLLHTFEPLEYHSV
ncbi:hypothetical protein TNCV_5096251 [Trichonephila clavipes]|nr:hypothetical protein TNCV_5096251 [Trichonephila clavipes]